MWKNKIVGHGEEAPDQLLANPLNARIHPTEQQDALEGSLEEIGWIQDVIVNMRTSEQWPAGEREVQTLVDGHARVKLAMRHGQEKIPVKYVDLTPNEERLALAVFDPIGAMAVVDEAIFKQLLEDTNTGNSALQELIAGLADSAKALTPPDDFKEVGEDIQTDHTCPKCGYAWSGGK